DIGLSIAACLLHFSAGGWRRHPTTAGPPPPRARRRPRGRGAARRPRGAPPARRRPPGRNHTTDRRPPPPAPPPPHPTTPPAALVADPAPTAPILETLKNDPALYVRKSVANHLNDIAKDHPEAVLDRVEGWDRAEPHTAWIVKHGLRTLIKKGHPRALALFGS